MQKEKGFTLIELIIVIVVLGILAVTAAPRFFDFSKDARISTLNGLKAAMQGASQVTYAKAAVEGKLGGTNTLPESVAGVATAYGYPAANENGILKSMLLDTTSNTGEWVFQVEPLHTPPLMFIGLASRPERGLGIKVGGCYVAYEASTGPNVAPVITADVSGC